MLPFLALGLGVDDMFLLAHTYASISERGEIHPSVSLTRDTIATNPLRRELWATFAHVFNSTPTFPCRPRSSLMFLGSLLSNCDKCLLFDVVLVV